MNSKEQIEFDGFEIDQPRQDPPVIKVRILEEIMESEMWTEAASSVEAFIEMVEEHAGTKSAGLAKEVLMSAILGSGSFPLHRTSCFDAKNIAHMLKILKAVGTYSGDFRSVMCRLYGVRINAAICA